jgi:4-hydroxybenzoate polyprenyltransferase
MTSRWQKLLTTLQHTRLELVFSAVSNIWVMVFLSWRLQPNHSGEPEVPAGSLAVALTLGGIVGVGLALYGMAINDAIDVRHDRAFSPDRPIPAGAIGLTGAVGLSVVSVLAAMLASVWFDKGSPVIFALTALAILFYNTTGKFVPAVGILLVGLARGLAMFIPSPWIGFAWPVWLAFTHVVFCYSIGHVLEAKRPRLRGAEGWGLCAGWAFWTLVLVVWMKTRGGFMVHGEPRLWLGPVLAVAAFACAALLLLHGRMKSLRSRRAVGTSFMRLAVLWLIVYDAVWLASLEMYKAAALHAALFAVAYGSIRALRLLRHLTAPPPGYRVQADPATPGGPRASAS